MSEWIVRFYDAHDGWCDLWKFPSRADAESRAQSENQRLPKGNREYGEYYRAFPADTQMVFDAKYDPYRTGKNAWNAED